MTNSEELLAEIIAFVRRKHWSKTYFGRRAVNDWKLVDRLESGGTVTLEKAAQIMTFIKEKSE
jgi:hypothetical protein